MSGKLDWTRARRPRPVNLDGDRVETVEHVNRLRRCEVCGQLVNRGAPIVEYTRRHRIVHRRCDGNYGTEG